jgi:hypothetical protein
MGIESSLPTMCRLRALWLTVVARRWCSLMYGFPTPVG